MLDVCVICSSKVLRGPLLDRWHACTPVACGGATVCVWLACKSGKLLCTLVLMRSMRACMCATRCCCTMAPTSACWMRLAPLADGPSDFLAAHTLVRAGLWRSMTGAGNLACVQAFVLH